uniref:Putative phagocytosis engulfment n=1 Tax=Corethrella appendiculata TaxID=1370023 RepID=U5EY58_9DIPT
MLSMNIRILFTLLNVIIIVAGAKICDIPDRNETGICVKIGDCKPYSILVKNISTSSLVKCDNLDDKEYICCPKTGFYVKDKVKRIRRDADEECGVQEDSDRIYGGEKAGIYEFPWMALLFYLIKETNSIEPACGGTLIHKRFVLTAAHCVAGTITKDFVLKYIRLGENNLLENPDCITFQNEKDCADPPIDFNPSKTLVHPEYNPQSWDKFNDIALIKLDHDTPYTDFIRPICLPDKFGFTDADILKITHFRSVGWGRTDYFNDTKPDTASPFKLEVLLPRVDTNHCAKVYDQMATIRINSSQICAGGGQGKDTCRGDSGGPLLWFDLKKLKWFIFGIVSKGSSQCGTEGVPSIYTNVMSYSNWINKTIKNNL